MGCDLPLKNLTGKQVNAIADSAADNAMKRAMELGVVNVDNLGDVVHRAVRGLWLAERRMWMSYYHKHVN